MNQKQTQSDDPIVTPPTRGGVKDDPGVTPGRLFQLNLTYEEAELLVCALVNDHAIGEMMAITHDQQQSVEQLERLLAKVQLELRTQAKPDVSHDGPA